MTSFKYFYTNKIVSISIVGKFLLSNNQVNYVMIYLILDVKTTYLCFYCGQMNLCYSLIKTLQTDVLLELIGLIEKLGFQAPESYKRKQK